VRFALFEGVKNQRRISGGIIVRDPYGAAPQNSAELPLCGAAP